MRRFRLPALAAAIALTLSACMAPTSREVRPVDDEPLLDKDWRLVATPNDTNLPTQGAGAAVLRFSPSRFSMAGPCNNHTGGWAREGDQLRLGGEGAAIASTKRGCPGELMQRESDLLAAFAQPLRTEFTGTQLRLATADGARWTFDSQDVPTSAGRERIVLVSTRLAPEQSAGLDARITVIVRENVGYDFYSFRTGILAIEALYAYDELIIANDSVVTIDKGGLGKAFAKMQDVACDVWGMTESYQVSRHLQSYFMVYRKSAFFTQYFDRFWRDVRVLEDKWEIILSYEVGQTQWLLSHGAKIAVAYEPDAAAEAAREAAVALAGWTLKTKPVQFQDLLLLH